MKQTDEKCNPLTYWGGLKKTEQEILEEAAENYAEGKSSSSVFQESHKRDFINGAKWQQEQMYIEMNDYANYRLLIKKPLAPKQWFEQLKNK